MAKGAETTGLRTLTTNDDGVGSLGISLLAAAARDLSLAAHAAHWETAQIVVRTLLPTFVEAAEERRSLVLNANIPDRALADLRGVSRAHLADFGAVQANVTETGKGQLNLQYTADERPDQGDSDATLLSRGFATVTPLLSVCEASDQEFSLPSMPDGR